VSGEYNGWKNYETWVVKLWIDNDGYAGGYETIVEVAEEVARKHADDRPAAVRELAKHIEEAIDSDIDHSDAKALTEGLFADLLGRSLGNVDWEEIAANYLEEFEFEGDESYGTEVDS
jgi:hypothetical protein